jgi:hypothetical protein
MRASTPLGAGGPRAGKTSLIVSAELDAAIAAMRDALAPRRDELAAAAADSRPGWIAREHVEALLAALEAAAA